MKRRLRRYDNLLQSSAEPAFMVRLSRWRVHLGFALGPAVFAVMLFIGPQGEIPPTAWAALALTALMAIWWVTEALPIAITALLPVALLPLLDIRPIEEAAAPTGDTPAVPDHSPDSTLGQTGYGSGSGLGAIGGC